MNKILRQVARSTKYQFLYSRAKELNNINIFVNNFEYTDIQIRFLQWVAIYDSLYQDLSRKENYINEEIINDDIRTDAYLVYRNTKDKSSDKKEEPLVKKQIADTVPGVIFKRGK